MTTNWVVTAATERLTLDAQRQGQLTFTVTNPGPARDRVVFEPVPGDGADRSWFTVDEPSRLVQGGASVSYLVTVAPPAGTPPASYTVQGLAYSADTPPEESSRLSGRVTFEVPAAPVPKKFVWWPYAVAAALVVLVLAVVGWLVLRPRDTTPPIAAPSSSAAPSASSSPSASPVTPPVTGPTPIRANVALTVPQTWTFDLDTGTIGTGSTDLWFEARTATDRVLAPQGAVTLVNLGVVQPDPRACTPTAFSPVPVPIQNLQAGSVVCVVTSQRQLAVVTVLAPVGPSPGQLSLRYDLYRAFP